MMLSTTTALPMTAVGTFSVAGLYPATLDIAGSDAFIAQAYGGNLVSGVPLSPASELVAGARRFAEESPVSAGLLSSKGDCPISAADAVASFGAVRSVTPARNEILTASGDDAGKTPPVAPPAQISLTDILHRAVPRTITARDYFAQMTPNELARVIEVAAMMCERHSDAKTAQELRDALVRSGEMKAKENEVQRYLTLLDEPVSLVYGLFATDDRRKLVNEMVEGWFSLPLNERTKINPAGNPYEAPTEWFQNEALERLKRWEINRLTSYAQSIVLDHRRRYTSEQPTDPTRDEFRRCLFSYFDVSAHYWVINMAVDIWFDIPRDVRRSIAPENPDQIPVEWFRKRIFKNPFVGVMMEEKV